MIVFVFFSSLCFFTNAYIHTPAVTTTTTINSVCPKCGIIAKPGEFSCCGRSGSWFGNCGSATNAMHDHTWYEGIRACKTLAQSKAAIGRYSNAAQQRNSSNGRPGMTNSKTVIIPADTFTFTSTSTSTPILLARRPSLMSVNAITTDWISQGVYMLAMYPL